MMELVVIAAVWLGIGLSLSLVLGRRGHDRYAWLVSGTILGPLAIVLALNALREEDGPAARPVVTARHTRGEGPVDVLAGVDGSPEALAALEAAFTLLADRIGRVTVATVVPFDGGTANEKDAIQVLEAARRRKDSTGINFEVLHGAPAQALIERATEAGYDLIVAGSRGRGGKVFGSAASELATRAKLPVLLIGGNTAERSGH